MKTISRIVLLSFAVFLLSCGGSTQHRSDCPIERRIDELMAKMTLQEKVGQMNQRSGGYHSESMNAQIRAGMIGSILNEVDPHRVNELQRIAVEESNLGIPILFARDVIHGFRTIFPIPLGMGASWNPELVELGARIAAVEATSQGVRWTFAPNIDVTRDPRWGRISEVFSEDPFLVSAMGAAMVRGFQTDDLTNPTAMAATAKHFAGYGASQSGRDYNTTWIPEIQLREVHLPPFIAAINAGVATVMTAFNDINGIPATGWYYLNRTILRDEWGFDGVLLSDWDAIYQMVEHGFAHDRRETAKLAAIAGVCMDMMSFAYLGYLEQLVNDGIVPRRVVDEAVRNILRLKFRLGLFDNPFVEIQDEAPFYSELALQAAYQAAVEGAVLLRNENNILPLNADNIRTVAIVGPLAHAPLEQLGTWIFDGCQEGSITPYMHLREQFGNRFRIIFEPGLEYSRDRRQAGINRAVAAARQADVVLFFAGTEAILEGEARSRAYLNLPGLQNEMLEALHRTGRPIVTTIMAGRPLIIRDQVPLTNALIYSFHAGTMAGPALIDLIFGYQVPSGKLPITFPMAVGQIPIYYAHKNTGRPPVDVVMMYDIPVGAGQFSIGATSYFMDVGNDPLFHFGFGLSYTTFEYSNVTLSSNSMRMGRGETITARATITNTGTRDAYEVVQLYIRDVVASIIQPVRELRGFDRVFLRAGESKEVEFTLTENCLAFWHADITFRAEPGEFRVWISPCSQTGTPVSFWLTD